MLGDAKQLPPSLAKLCNRLAAERTKAEIWRLGQQLRQEYVKRLRGGESLAELEADIQVQVLQAAQDQILANIARARAIVKADTSRSMVQGTK
jgi:hypothetical protein